jgi:hypothetical protein
MNLGRIGPPNKVVALTILVIATCLIPWIVFLGFSLPPHYDAGHWPLLWIGYDVGEVTVLAFAAWAAWFRREVLAPACLVLAILLFCDAWFDIVTSWGHRDQWITLATGIGAEIPLGIAFLLIYRWLVLKALNAFHEAVHDGLSSPHLVTTTLLFPKGTSTGTAVTIGEASIAHDRTDRNVELSHPDLHMGTVDPHNDTEDD